jgi:hypothetical protein
MENIQEMLKDVLHLGHHLRRVQAKLEAQSM